ncbi:MAG: ABC transporter ATP-binding protein, partial [Pseudonocardia sp.]
MTARELLPTAGPRETWTAVRRLLAGRRGAVWGATAVLVAGTSAGLLAPPILGAIVDIVVGGGAVERLDLLVVALLAAVIAESVLSGWGVVLVARVGETALATLRERVLERALGVSLADVERGGGGDLVARVSGDVESVSDGLREALPTLAGAALTVALTVVGMGVLDWRLALAGFAVLPIHVAATRWYLRRSTPVYAAERVARGELTAALAETVSGSRTVAAFGLEREHRARVDTVSEVAVQRSLVAARLRSRFFASLNAAECVGLTSVLAAGFLTVQAGVTSVGVATAAALYFHRLFNPFNQLLGLLDDAQNAAAALGRLVGVASLEPPAAPALPATPRDASVKVAGARFAYRRDHEVLSGVDLALDPGERLALVGPSGAGKTTIAKLVSGIHTPGGGAVYLGGHTPAELGPGGTRRTVALVTQEVHVFAGTLAEDLRLADPDAPDAALLTALDLVGAREWVEALPDVLATVVGDGGHALTVLQAQQLAL